MKKALTVIGFLIVVWTIAYSVWPLSGLHEWMGRPWVRLQPGEVIVESTLVVEDTIATDFIVPDDSGTVHVAGWADSSLWADSSSHALNADSLGGSIVADNVLLSSRADTTDQEFFFLGDVFVESHLQIKEDKHLAFSNADTSTMWYDVSDARIEWYHGDGIELFVQAETLLLHSFGEVGPLAVFADSSGDDVLTIYNEGGISLAKDWQGIGTWTGTNSAGTLAVVGITTSSIALVEPCDLGVGDTSFDCWTDTCVITRETAAREDSFGYLIVK